MCGLKEAIHDEIGKTPDNQDLFFLGHPLDDPEDQIQEMLEMSNTFNLVLQTKDMKMFQSDKKMFLITGRKRSFSSISIEPDQPENINMKANKFGVVQHIEGKEPGTRIYTFRQYKADREGRIEYRTEKVFLIDKEGFETELSPLKLTTYDESRQLFGRDIANTMGPYVKALVSFLSECKYQNLLFYIHNNSLLFQLFHQFEMGPDKTVRHGHMATLLSSKCGIISINWHI